MPKKSSAASVAVIEIGSNSAKMNVSQLKKGEIVPLDFLEHPIGLGHDVFENGTISFDSLRELSTVLTKFSSALLSYGTQKVKVISCTAMREAGNHSLVVDQLKVRNGIDVTVLEDSLEKAYIYSEIVKKLPQMRSLEQGCSLIAYIGSGSIGVSVLKDDRIVYSQNIPLGTLKLHDVLSGFRKRAEDFHYLMEEYLDTVLNRIDVSDYDIRNIIITGSQADLASKLCGAEENGGIRYIATEKLTSLFDSMRFLTDDSISMHWDIPEERASLLYIALFIYSGMLRFCPKAKVIISPDVSISDGVTRYMLMPKSDVEWNAFLRRNALACAETMAGKYKCNLEHAEHISSFSCRIFDRLKKIHGLESSKRMILELASLLHSCGSYVSVHDHNNCTYDLIKNMDIFGLSRTEVLQVAFVAGSVSDDVTARERLEFSELSQKEQLVVLKLSAIFRMANALDKSHRVKLRDLSISIEDDRIIFKAEASVNTLLERWAFEESAKLFKDIFGLSPELSVKFDMMR